MRRRDVAETERPSLLSMTASSSVTLMRDVSLYLPLVFAEAQGWKFSVAAASSKEPGVGAFVAPCCAQCAVRGGGRQALAPGAPPMSHTRH